jgi:hypothetical protein
MTKTIKNENPIFNNSPWTQAEVEAWIKQNVIANIQNYKTPDGDYWINVILPLRKIGFGEYSYASAKYLGPSLNLNLWNIDFGPDKPKVKYMLCIGGPFDQTYETQWYAAEHGYCVFNQSSKVSNDFASILVHSSLLK